MARIIPEEVIKILNGIKSPKFEDVLRTSLASGYNDYYQNMHNTQAEDVAGLEELSKLLYLDWRQAMLDRRLSSTGVRRQVADALATDSKYNPENIARNSSETNTPFYDFFLKGYEENFPKGATGAKLQGGSIISEVGASP